MEMRYHVTVREKTIQQLKQIQMRLFDWCVTKFAFKKTVYKTGVTINFNNTFNHKTLQQFFSCLSQDSRTNANGQPKIRVLLSHFNYFCLIDIY